MSVTTKTITLTPKLAQEYLSNQKPNRKLKTKALREMIIDLRNSRWRDTGDTIKFNCNGQMIDGQHRCHMVVAAGIPIRVITVHGVTDQAATMIDQGKVRKLCDVLEMRGVKNATVISSVLNCLFAYGRSGIPVAGCAGQLNNQSGLDLYEFHQVEIDEAASRTHGLYRACGLGHLFLATLPVLISSPPGERTWDDFANGIMTCKSETCPAMRFREKSLQFCSVTGRVRGHRMSSTGKWCNLINAWNHFSNFARLTQLRTTETVPEIRFGKPREDFQV